MKTFLINYKVSLIIVFISLFFSKTCFAVTFVSDSFTGSAGTTLVSHTGEVGATWAANTIFPSSSVIISDANRARSNLTGFSVYYASGTPSSADYSVSADFYAATVNSTAFGVLGRSATTAATYYLFDYEAGVLKLYTVVNGAAVGTTTTLSWLATAGQTYNFKLTMEGSTITGYINGIQMLQKTDSAITSIGKAGFFFNGNTTNSTSFHMDNFLVNSIQNATTFTLSGPSIGGKDEASSNFTVTPDNAYTGTVTITPSGGGLSSPIVLTFSNSASPQTFTITPTAYGTVTLTPTNSGSLTNPSALSYVSTTTSGLITINQSNLWENGYDNVANPRQSPLSFIRLTTDATTLSVVGTTTNFSSTPTGYASLGLRIDGVDQAPITFSANGQSTTTVSLSSGTKTIDIISGTQNRPSSTILGTFIDAFRLLDFSTYTLESPVSTGRLLIYGDSISNGYTDSVNYGTKGWASLLRNSGRKLMVEGYGYRSLKDDAINSGARSTFVSRIGGYTPNSIWLAVGTNDYGLNQWSAPSFGTAYTALLDDLHTALPSASIFCQTPLLRTTETVNGSGSTLGDYRAQINTACSARPWTTLIDGTTILSTSDLSDGIHPSTSGHEKYKNFVAPYVSTNGGVLISLSASSGDIGDTVTATLTRALSSTFLSGDTLTLNWGDGNTSTVTPTVGDTTTTIDHTYLASGDYSISVTNNRSWPNPGNVSYSIAAPPTPTPSQSSRSSGGISISSRIKNLIAMGKNKEAEILAKQWSQIPIPNSTKPNSTPGYAFKRNLSVGMKSSEVKELQKYLNQKGFIVAKSGAGSPGKETNYFGLLTLHALVKFQEAHALDILTPVGLTKGTGYLGETTRIFINK